MRFAVLFLAACSSSPVPVGDPWLDLALVDSSADLAHNADDLLVQPSGADLTVDPPDLAVTSDLATCGGIYHPPMACGAAGQPCCPSPACECAGGLFCMHCAGSLTMCAPSSCGGMGQPCCASSCNPYAVGTCNVGLTCPGPTPPSIVQNCG